MCSQCYVSLLGYLCRLPYVLEFTALCPNRPPERYGLDIGFSCQESN
jgi:hypothetical protein